MKNKIIKILFLSLLIIITHISSQPQDEDPMRRIKLEITDDEEREFDHNNLEFHDSEGNVIPTDITKVGQTRSVIGENNPEITALKEGFIEELEEIYDKESVNEFMKRVNRIYASEVEYFVHEGVEDEPTIHLLFDVTDHTKVKGMEEHVQRKARLFSKAIALGDMDANSEIAVLTYDIPKGVSYELNVAKQINPELVDHIGAMDLQLYGIKNLWIGELKELIGVLTHITLDTSEKWKDEIGNLIELVGNGKRIFSKALRKIPEEEFEKFPTVLFKVQKLLKDWKQNGPSDNLKDFGIDLVEKSEWFYLLKYIAIKIASLPEDIKSTEIENISPKIEAYSLDDLVNTLKAWIYIHDYLDITLTNLSVQTNIEQILKTTRTGADIYIVTHPSTKKAIFNALETKLNTPESTFKKTPLETLDCHLNLSTCPQTNSNTNTKEDL